MQNGQIVSNSDQALFSGAITSGRGELPDGVNPDITNSINTGIYSSDHDAGSLGSAAMKSVADKSPENQTAGYSNEINGDLLAKPENTSALELVPKPEIDPNSVQLGIPTEVNLSSGEANHKTNHIPINLEKNGEVSINTIRAVMKEAQGYKNSSTGDPADFVDTIDQAREDIDQAREEDIEDAA